jgi:hypothetical protein
MYGAAGTRPPRLNLQKGLNSFRSALLIPKVVKINRSVGQPSLPTNHPGFSPEENQNCYSWLYEEQYGVQAQASIAILDPGGFLSLLTPPFFFRGYIFPFNSTHRQSKSFTLMAFSPSHERIRNQVDIGTER